MAKNILKGGIIMTNEQKKDFEQLILKRRRMEEPGAILDLIIQFFQLMNEAFKSEIASITGIEWRASKSIFSEEICWKAGFIDDEKWIKEKGITEKNVMKLALFELLDQLNNVRQKALDEALNDCKEQLSACGLEVKMEKDVKGIYIA